jgi:hypothetical protein
MTRWRTACWKSLALTALFGCGSRDDAMSALYGPDVSGAQGEELVCAPLPPGAIAWWPGDGSAADIIGRHDGRWGSFSRGLVRRGFYFSGSPETARFPFERVPGDFSIEFWFRPDPAIVRTDPRSHLLFARGQSHSIGTANYLEGMDCDFCNGRLEVRGPQPRPHTLLDTWTEWRHIALTYRELLYELYVDGEPERQNWASDVSLLDQLDDVTLATDGTNPETRYAGLLDEITVYERALDPDEVLSIYNAGNAGKCRTFKDVSR